MIVIQSKNEQKLSFIIHIYNLTEKKQKCKTLVPESWNWIGKWKIKWLGHRNFMLAMGQSSKPAFSMTLEASLGFTKQQTDWKSKSVWILLYLRRVSS